MVSEVGIAMIETYEDLLAALKLLSPDQLKQKVQVNDPTDGSGSDDSLPVILQYAYSIGTVRELFETGAETGELLKDHQVVRDSYTGKHNSDNVVILVDRSGFEDDTELKQLRVAKKALEKIQANLASGEKIYEMARAALEKINNLAEKKKEKNTINSI